MQFFEQRGLADRIEACVCQGDKFEIGGAAFHVISPEKERLEAYRKFWDREMEKQPQQNLKAHSAKRKQHKKELSAYLDDSIIEDKNLVNGSSIAFVMEYGDCRAVFLGDAWPSECVHGIKQVYPSGTKVDFVKIPYHGSVRNFSESLYKLLETKCFLLSTNGERNHPAPAFWGNLFRQIPDAKIYCNIDWMQNYGFTEKDEKRYCLGTDSQICRLKKEVFLTETLTLSTRIEDI